MFIEYTFTCTFPENGWVNVGCICILTGNKFVNGSLPLRDKCKIYRGKDTLLTIKEGKTQLMIHARVHVIRAKTPILIYM